jgi:hypothetical protein
MSEDQILWELPLSRAYAYEHVALLANSNLRLRPLLGGSDQGLIDIFEKMIAKK